MIHEFISKYERGFGFVMGVAAAGRSSLTLHDRPQMATLTDLPHSLETRRRVTWSTAQEKGISNDFPFDRNEETPEQFVFRTYLQFLWLPEVLSTAFYACCAADTLYSQ